MAVKTKKWLTGIFSIALIIALFWMLRRATQDDKTEKEVSVPVQETQNSPASIDVPKAVTEPFTADLSFPALILASGDTVSMKQGIVMNNPASEVDSAQALQLALFYQISKEDPLLFGETGDYEALKKSVAALEKERTRMNELMGRTDEIYPIAFLQEYINASLAFQKLSKQISFENADGVLEGMEHALDAYAKGATSLHTAFSLMNTSESAKKKIAFLGGQTTTDAAILLADMDLLRKNVQAMRVLVEQRKKCLHESVEYCARDLTIAPKQELVIGEIPTMLTPEEIGIPNNNKPKGPFLIQSNCWRGSGLHLLSSATHCADDGLCYQWSYLLDNTFFVRLSDTAPFDQKMKSEGLELLPQSATSPYACNDLTYAVRLKTIANLFESKNRYLFEKIQDHQGDEALRKFLEDGNEAERTFFTADYPSDAMLEALAYAYKNAYTHAVLHNQLVAQERNELLMRYLTITEYMQHFDLVLNRTIFHLRHLDDTAMRTGKQIPPVYVYPSRSNYALTFLTFSPHMWRIDEQLQFMRTEKLEMEKMLGDAVFMLDYQQALQEYSKEQLLQWQHVAAGKSRDENQ